MKKYNLFTSKEIKATGWLKRQLEAQADGLNGNLHKVWRDVRDSAWIGGDAEGWERVPYWLDGFIPMAYLLEDEEKISVAKKYIDAIIASQREDGWICPCKDEDIPEYDTWAVQLIAKVLTVYYECSGDERIPPVIYKAVKNYYELLSSGRIKLFNWGKFRWFETFIAIDFLYKHYNEEWLKDLARILKDQGVEYFDHIDSWKRSLNKWTYHTHIVNLVMMLKSEGVSCDFLGEEYTDRAEVLRGILDEYNGTPVEIFTGDECLGGLSPIHGTELCAVVELMYSYELLYAYTGDRKWAERLEVIAFNALPAANSDDMWAHQYDQLSNQIACVGFPGKPIFTTNGYNAHVFGLEPEFGCCTANFGQGWPKLALSAFMYNDNEIVNALPIPATLETEGVKIHLETDYPFKNSFKYTISSEKDLTFRIRIPSFAKNITVNHSSVSSNEDILCDIKAGSETELLVSYDIETHYVNRPYDLKAVRRGSLVFSLPIEYEVGVVEYTRNEIERKFPYCDYEYFGKSDWNYAYCGSEFEVEERDIHEIPFYSAQPPIVLKTKGVKIDWGLEDGYETVCAKTPKSREPLCKPEEITLYPYGCAKLRMTELPLVKEK